MEGGIDARKICTIVLFGYEADERQFGKDAQRNRRIYSDFLSTIERKTTSHNVSEGSFCTMRPMRNADSGAEMNSTTNLCIINGRGMYSKIVLLEDHYSL